MGGHVARAALDRAQIEPDEIEDVIMGCANPEGATGHNIARQIALRAGLPVTGSGVTVNRFCSSGLQTVALASQRIQSGEGDVYIAGGVESISCVQNEMNQHMAHEGWLVEHKPEIYWSMSICGAYLNTLCDNLVLFCIRSTYKNVLIEPK